MALFSGMTARGFPARRGRGTKSAGRPTCGFGKTYFDVHDPGRPAQPSDLARDPSASRDCRACPSSQASELPTAFAASCAANESGFLRVRGCPQAPKRLRCLNSRGASDSGIPPGFCRSARPSMQLPPPSASRLRPAGCLRVSRCPAGPPSSRPCRQSRQRPVLPAPARCSRLSAASRA